MTSTYSNIFSLGNTRVNQLQQENNSLRQTNDDLKSGNNSLVSSINDLKNKINNPLKDNYGNQINIPSSSDLSETSKKPVYSQNSGYDQLTQALKANVDNYYSLMNRQITKKAEIQSDLDKYKALGANTIDIKYKLVKNENDIIENKIGELKDTYSTDNQKVRYQADKIISLRAMNFILYIVYFVLFLTLIYVLVFMNKTLSMKMKIVIIIIFFLYPFVIDLFQQFLYFLWKYIYAILNGNVYTSNNY
jgi:hypothetical protein